MSIIYSPPLCIRCIVRNLRISKPSHLVYIATKSRSQALCTRTGPLRITEKHPQVRLSQPSSTPLLRFYSSTVSPPGSSAASPPPPPSSSQSQPTNILLNPRYLPSGDLKSIQITPRAARRLGELIKNENNPELCLRVQVESGGCHGFQYLMSLTSTTKLDKHEDTLFVIGSTAGSSKAGQNTDITTLGGGLPKVAMDQATLDLLEGSKVDYTMELIGSQFKIADNPRATSSCGCGTSFDLKGDSSNSTWGI
jgi:Fe-S cluster assembly iron-binding protein IscA